MTQEQRKHVEEMLIDMIEKAHSVSTAIRVGEGDMPCMNAAAELTRALVSLDESAPKIPATVHVTHMIGDEPLDEASPVRGISVELPEKDELAWKLVEQAIENSAYHAQEEFDKLPPLARRIVGSPQNLQEWNLMFDKCGDEVSTNFRRAFRTVSGREKPRGRLGEVTVVLHVDTTELDAALAKAERLADILRKIGGGETE